MNSLWSTSVDMHWMNRKMSWAGAVWDAPIFDRTGYPIAAVSVSIPIQRFPDNDIEKFGKKLISTAENISKQMGHFKENS